MVHSKNTVIFATRQNTHACRARAPAAGEITIYDKNDTGTNSNNNNADIERLWVLIRAEKRNEFRIFFVFYRGFCDSISSVRF